jgi:molybdopterin-biosynthesis enzyme MoeA-like protein
MALPRSLLVIVGDELLAGFTVDSNGPLAARRLFEMGYPVGRIEIVGDAAGDIAAAVCIRALVENGTALGRIEAQVARMHRAGWLDSPIPSTANRRMAQMAAGGRVLENRRGMAPPLAVELGNDRWLFVLPGVPREFESALEEAVIPAFFAASRPFCVVELRWAGVPEAEIAGPMLQLELEFPDVTVGSYPQQGRELIVRLRGEDSARVRAAAARLRELRGGERSATGARGESPAAHRGGGQP